MEVLLRELVLGIPRKLRAKWFSIRAWLVIPKHLQIPHIGAMGVSAVQEKQSGGPDIRPVSSEIDSLLSGLIKNYDYGLQNFMPEVSTNTPLEYGDKGMPTIVLLDVGTKK